MSTNFTSTAQKALEKTFSTAKKYKNYQIEPEHLLLALMELDIPVVEKNLTREEKSKMKNELIRRIGALARGNEDTMPNPSHKFTNLLQDAQANKQEVSEVDLLGATIKYVQIDGTGKLETVVRGVRESKTPTLDSVALEMVHEARTTSMDPVIGRVKEIRSIIEILAKKKKSNPMLVGPAGVGKTAIVCGLAQLISKNEAPGLTNYRIYNLDVGSMVANTGVRGEFEERVRKVVKEAEECPNIILFIDEIHTVISAGSTSGSLDFSNILKPSLAAGKIKIIGATTHDEYRKYMETDAAFCRRFVKVTINEPSIEDSITMLRGLRNKMELHHGIKIEDSAIVFSVKMAKKYISNRRLPDIAIDLVDTACASATIELESEPQEILNMKNRIWSLELERAAIERDYKIKRDASEKDERDSAARTDEDRMKSYSKETKERLNEVMAKIEEARRSLVPLEETYEKERASVSEAKALKTKIDQIYSKIEEARRRNDTYQVLDLQTEVLPVIERKLKEIEGSILITSAHIATVISRWTGIPVRRLTLKENERLLGMADRIKHHVFGQDTAVDRVVQCILRNRVGLSESDRPIGAFLFLGPSGVGKTELAKAIAFELFDDAKSMVVLDMSDYANEISITKLLGVSAGYVGYAEGGALTEPVKEKPYNVVLFDELDLAHPKVVNVLYQLLDEGRVTDGKRNVIDFTNTVIVMTSNLGYEKILTGVYDTDEIERGLNERFGPALINRIDGICYFNALSMVDLRSILDYKLATLNKELNEKKIYLYLSNAVKQDVINRNYKPVYGARPLKRALRSTFMDAIAHIMLTNSKMIERAEKVLINSFTQDEGLEGLQIGDYVYVVQYE
ncbi:hypothetical protein VCUG_02019 [Vavraia culicis subsp. floridensis]|uniref:ATP-dependent chaperone ClpB n=1 Tax=Vavraia culicis (isolate floridensis) TaxID=948595 RepID=L2GTQ9_VAVCU|nr:uncharacterized protein VCUG_02019 [Vavraia culicis subsp. floridensis]ELA46475.1 hypothetical protein VCUG_02019 [Vavraia culicis subsp. floridensis]